MPLFTPVLKVEFSNIFVPSVIAAARPAGALGVAGQPSAPGGATVTATAGAVRGAGAAMPPTAQGTSTGSAIHLVSQGAIAGSGAPSFGQATGSGNLLVAFVGSNGNASSFTGGVSGSGWTLAASGGGAYAWGALWYKANSSASESPPTFSDSAGSVYYSQLAEFAGVATASPVDQAGGVAAAAAAQGATYQIIFSGPDTQAGDLVCSAGFFNGANAGGTIAVQGFTDSTGGAITPHLQQASNAGVYINTLWGITAATGGQADDILVNLSVYCGGGGAAASFKAANASTGTLTVTPMTLPADLIGFPYPTKTLAASGGTPPYTWSVSAGTLPSGISLSSGGVLSGTCGASGTFNFTAKVTDSKGSTGTGPFTIIVNPAPAGRTLRSTSAPSGTIAQDATGNNQNASPGFVGNTGGNDYLAMDDQGIITGNGGSQTIAGYDLSNFYVTANALNVGGAVQTGPASYCNTWDYGTTWGNGPNKTPLSSFSYWTSTYTVLDPDVGVFEAAWDIWTNYTTTSGNLMDIMIWVDIPPARGNGGASQLIASNLTFGGAHGVPSQKWDLWRWAGVGTELIFTLQGPGGSGTYARQQSGTVDILNMLLYCQNSGLVPAPMVVSLIFFGWEICQTNGVENFICMNHSYSWG